MKNKLNTIYIISKGRPLCTTAKTLDRIGYPGPWYIVCGDNDATLPEYIANWGKERIIIFDWKAQLPYTEVNDNFGFETLGSGAVPVRNITAKISSDRGELRHWQFDDDYHAFYANRGPKKQELLDGPELENLLYKIAEFGHNCRLSNVGFGMSTIETAPENSGTFTRRVFNGHNLPSLGDLWVPWRSRMNDDLVNVFDTYRQKPGASELSFRFLKLSMPMVGEKSGGNMEIYKNVLAGMVRKVAYAILVEPHNIKLTYDPKADRVHHRVNWTNLVPKLISSKYEI